LRNGDHIDHSSSRPGPVVPVPPRQGGGFATGCEKDRCSGLAYVVNYADDVSNEDEVFETGGVKVVVDRGSLRYIDGTEVDFVREGLNEAFRFRNPNVAGECGCGESFNI